MLLSHEDWWLKGWPIELLLLIKSGVGSAISRRAAASSETCAASASFLRQALSRMHRLSSGEVLRCRRSAALRRRRFRYSDS